MPDSETPAHDEWRREVTSRIQQHRARRGRQEDAEQAMAFDFSAEEALTVTDGPVIRDRVRRRFQQDPEAADDSAAEALFVSPELPKVIRFPRSLSMIPETPAERIQLPAELTLPAEPLPPRIVDVEGERAAPGEPGTVGSERTIEPARPAEQMELLPSFEDIRLEPAEFRERINNEVIPRPAAISQRLVATAVDVAAVFAAAMLFNFAFVRMAEDDPHSRLALLFGFCVTGILWILFQYLFLVHGKGTPGMRFAQLELATFDGKPLSTMSRRYRAAASALSAVSIGLGYAWALVDEDQLGWHDRITRTLLRSSSQPATENGELWD